MTSLRTVTAIVISVSALLCLGLGLYSAAHSSMFLVQVVEVSDLDVLPAAPVDAQAVIDLASVPVGKVSLFELDLAAVEKRILSNPWIREARLQKQFPQTLSISVTLREPRALLQEPGGALDYVDSDGKVFGRVNLLTRADLPVLSGIGSKRGIADALQLLQLWERSPVSPLSQISSLTWDDEHGFRALVYYSLARVGERSRQVARPRARTLVDLGHELDPGLDRQFHRLAAVFRYLSDHSIAADQIWADSGKKIVVRTAHGS